MKTGLLIGVPVVAALIGVVCLTVRPVQTTPFVSGGWPHSQGSRSSAETVAPPTTRADRSAPTTATDEPEETFLLGEQVRQALSSDDPAVRRSVIRRGLRSWVRADPDGAAHFAQGITDEPLREQVMRVVAQTWSKRDPEKAVAWAAALPDEIERRVYLGAVCIGLASLDPAKAVQRADALGLYDDGVLAELTTQWAAWDQAAALTWVSRRPAGQDRDHLMQRVAFAEAQTDPARAAALVVEEIRPGFEQTEAVISVVNQWALRDPAAASAWVADFAPGVLRDRALGELRGLTAGTN